MYIIKCQEDGSFCMVENEDVICDENVIQIGDCVPFVWNSKRYTGEVVKCSDNVETLRQELKKIQSKGRSFSKCLSPEKCKKIKTRGLHTAFNDKDETTEKENIKKKIKIETQINIPKVAHNTRGNKQLTNTNYEYKDLLQDISVEKNITKVSELKFDRSPSKDELKKILFNLLQQNCTQKSAENIKKVLHVELQEQSTHESEEENDEKESTLNMIEKENSQVFHTIRKPKEVGEEAEKDEKREVGEEEKDEAEDEETKSQLFGRKCEDSQMVLLQDNIFCKKKIYDYATGSSTVASHLARRLLEGVFKQEALLKSTFTGQSPRAQGRERQKENVQCLHNIAKYAILDFSLKWAAKKGWKEQSMKEVKMSMIQRLTEIKRAAKLAEKEK